MRAWKAWHCFAIGALLALGAVPAEAQFTTAIVPPKRPQPAEQPVAAGETARRDTAIAARLTDMKAWVDSAAGTLAVRPPEDSAIVDTAVVVDTAVAVVPGEVEKPAERAQGARRFEEGAAAPDTASPLALLTLLGAGLIAAGAMLRRR